MDRQYYQKSDYTHIYNYLMLKIPRFILFIPFAANALVFLVFSSFLDVKLTDRKLALKIRAKHNAFVILFPLLIILSLVISTLVLSLNYHNWNLPTYTFFLSFVGHFFFFTLVNPFVLSLRNNFLEKEYLQKATENKITNFYNPTVINNWENYLLNYLLFFKGKSIYRASENFKLSVQKPIIFNDRHIEYKKDSEFEKYYYAFFPFQMLLSKYFGSLFSSTWLGYLLILSINFQDSTLKQLKIKNKIFISWLVNFVFGISLVGFGAYLSFVELKFNQYLIYGAIFLGIIFIYFLVSIIKMFVIRKMIKLEILSNRQLIKHQKHQNNLATDFLTVDKNDASEKTLVNNLLRTNRYMIQMCIIVPFIISLIFIILGFSLAIPMMYYIAFGFLVLIIIINYIWIAFLFYLAKKINCEPILVNKVKIILFSPLSLFLKS